MTSSILHRSIGFIFLIAFLSLYIQSPGLYGPNGLLPVDHHLSNILPYIRPTTATPPEFLSFISSLLQQYLPSFFILSSYHESSWSSLLQSYLNYPSLLIFSSQFHLSGYVIYEFLLILGIFYSTIIALGNCHGALFFIIWISYLSVYLFGQIFLSFQWDILLLEVGFLTFLSTLFTFHGKSYHHFHWCYRFLIWKLMFMAGVVKLQANCPTWLGLTALEVR